MASRMLNVLYVGSNAGARTFKVVSGMQDWHTYLPKSVNEALGMYIFYTPDVIVFEGESETAQAVFDHLAEVTHASPRFVEAMLVLSDGELWQAPESAVLHQISAYAEPMELISAIAELVQVREEAVFAQQYADEVPC